MHCNYCGSDDSDPKHCENTPLERYGKYHREAFFYADERGLIPRDAMAYADEHADLLCGPLPKRRRL